MEQQRQEHHSLHEKEKNKSRTQCIFYTKKLSSLFSCNRKTGLQENCIGFLTYDNNPLIRRKESAKSTVSQKKIIV